MIRPSGVNNLLEPPLDNFFKVKSVAEVLALAELTPRLKAESVPLDQTPGRSLAEDLVAGQNLPGFTRSTMDGFAVRAKDTFGAGEGQPAYLELCGQVLMGQKPDFDLSPGRCARIGTGGMLPKGADAVVMLEHTRMLDDATVEIIKPAAPGGNTIGPTDDAKKGQVLLSAGQVIRPQDAGLLASLGIGRVMVVRKPKVGIISTGDEVVPIEASPGPGQVRDVNTYTLSAQVAQAGGEPLPLGLAPDQADALKKLTAQSRQTCDLTLLSGGSSVGVRDFTVEVFGSFPQAELLVHGVAVSPGKPFIWVRAGESHLLGLPGQVASCMVAFHIFVEPILERMLGRPAQPFRLFTRAEARLTRPAPSANGREEYVRVKVFRNGDGLAAEPVFGKSGLLTTLIRGNGLLRIPARSEGLYQGDPGQVFLFPGAAV